MKKTLIALAVLAASGASFAQVTITGNLTMGYQATTTGGINGIGGTDSAGFGTDTSEINFTATEDLGGGTKATARMGLAGADRSGESAAAQAAGKNNAVTGREGSLTLDTSMGRFAIASTSSADYLSGGLAGVGAYYSGWDGKVFSARTNRDVVSYALPMGAFTLSTSYQESSGAANQGLGKGTTGAPGVTTSSLTTYGASYAKGPLAGNFTYLLFNSPIGANKDQIRLSGNYDLGVAKLGAGVVVTNGSVVVGTNPKTTDMLLGAAMPMGAVTLGLEIVSRRFDDFVNSGTVTGTSLQASYALSKRTSMVGNYARWTQPSAVAGAGITLNQDANTQYQLLLSHSF